MADIARMAGLPVILQRREVKVEEPEPSTWADISSEVEPELHINISDEVEEAEFHIPGEAEVEQQDFVDEEFLLGSEADNEVSFESEEIEFQVRVNSDNELVLDSDGAVETVDEDCMNPLALPMPEAGMELGVGYMEEPVGQGGAAGQGKRKRRRSSKKAAGTPTVGGPTWDSKLHHGKEKEELDACPLCAETGESFVGAEEEMAGHLVQVHNIMEYGFECSECGFKTVRRSDLTKHINQTHLTQVLKFSCDLCDFQTKWRNRIKSHKVSVHKVGGLRCPSCDYTACDRWVLNQHVKMVHRPKTGEGGDSRDPKYQCGSCEYRASQKSHLKTHVEAIHQELMLVCDMCPYQTKWKSRLQSHTKAKHMGEFIYCDHCEFQTIEKHQLKKHIEKRHGDIKFACFTCNDNFLTRPDLRKHMGDVHHMEIL